MVDKTFPDPEDQSSNSYPFVSIVIPVFNHAQQLRRCLQALENQTYPKSHYEVIVVDNGSDPEEDIQSVVAQFPMVLLTSEAIPGSYAARNQGISLAKGTIVAFTDADCVPDANWLKAGIEHLINTPNCGFVAGPIEIFFRQPHQPNAVELYEYITGYDQKDFLSKYQGAATANLLTFKQILEKVGLFNPKIKSSGDIEWCKRVCEAGYAYAYAENAKVAHPARSSVGELYQRTVRLVGGRYDLQQGFWGRLSLLFSHGIPPVFFILTTISDPKLKTWTQKVQVSSIILLVRYISFLEIILLILGKSAARK